jgi:aromatic-amino-acid transaminase
MASAPCLSFSAVEMAPRDPILGLNEQFNADTNPNKVNLGVGVYFDDNGKLPLLQCVQAAEKTMMDKPTARGYLPIDGIAAYDAASKAWCLVPTASVVKSGRVATVQGHWRHRRPENWRRLPEKSSTPMPRC